MASITDVLTRKPKNIAIETNPQHELNVVETEVLEPGQDDCLVHVRATGICGSDVHFWKSGAIGDSVIRHDLGLGHESAGIVIKTGSNVKGLNPGILQHCRNTTFRANCLVRR
jgi:L-iditol 2-dehydrogenase